MRVRSPRSSPDELTAQLIAPRSIWMMVPVARVDATIDTFAPLLERGDILIDGGNTRYHEDIRRAKELESSGIHCIDVGTSGGVWGLERGYCLMIGGEDRYRPPPRPHFRFLVTGYRLGTTHPGP